MRIIIAGGGTGGHLFPGIAIAEEFTERTTANRIMFVGTKRGLEERIIPTLGYDLRIITSAGILGGSMMTKIIGLGFFVVGLLQSFAIIVRFRPQLVVGTGGYVSAPVVMAAWVLHIKTAICEQNSIPGLTNRMLSKLVAHVCIAFEDSMRYFPRQKTVCTGNPVRKAFLSSVATQAQKRSGTFCLLILGGSQGAHSLNSAMVAALDRLDSLRDSLHVIHQTGVTDHRKVAEAYEEKGFSAEVAPFIDDMAAVYHKADLVVSRAGAITLTELLVCGKPAILVPYPHAAHNHQEMNARAVVEEGAAAMILDGDLSKETLEKAILNLYHDPERLERMAVKARNLARPEAAQVIVDLLIS